MPFKAPIAVHFLANTKDEAAPTLANRSKLNIIDVSRGKKIYPIISPLHLEEATFSDPY